MSCNYKTNELYHHGIKGMKWGVRKDYSSVRRLHDKELYNLRTSNN